MKEVQFLQYSIELVDQYSAISSDEWWKLYGFFNKQSLIGIGFQGVERLSANDDVPKELLFQWIGDSKQIEIRNKLLNQRCLELQRLFQEAGFRSCILKGQGNALMYPNPLIRQSGDIDIWVRDDRRKKADVRGVLDLLKTKCDMAKQVIGYHHVEFPVFKDVEVEVHWRPSWQANPWYNKRLQKWFYEQAEAQFANFDKNSGLHVPTWEFNAIYQLQHMFLHVLQEGLGLRQVMDYYYLLKSEGREDKISFESTLKWLGLYPFAGAMMYVLKEVFSLDDKYMIATMNERKGKFLLEEILQSGNFGKSDERNAGIHKLSGIQRSLARVKRSLRFLKEYPEEVLCAPFQIYHLIWRKLQLWRYE